MNELHDRLSLLTCQGPYYYCESNNGSSCNKILRYQPQWSFDNSFLSDEPHNQDEFDGSLWAGHFNATDWMLAYNIYLILSNTESNYLSVIDKQLNASWPTFEYGIYSESTNSPAIWGATKQKGSITSPNYIYGMYIHSTEKYLSQEVTSIIDNIGFNGQPDIQVTYTIYGDGDYTAKELISLEPGFEVAIGAQFSAEIGEEKCSFASNYRIRNPNNSEPIGPKFKAVNHHLDEYYKKTLPVPIRQFGNEGIQVFPNPSISGFNLKINANSNSVIKLTLLDLNGKQIQEFKEVTLQKGINQPYLTYDNIPAGVYQLSIIGNEINSVLRLIKM